MEGLLKQTFCSVRIRVARGYTESEMVLWVNELLLKRHIYRKALFLIRNVVRESHRVQIFDFCMSPNNSQKVNRTVMPNFESFQSFFRTFLETFKQFFQILFEIFEWKYIFFQPKIFAKVWKLLKINFLFRLFSVDFSKNSRNIKVFF